MATFVSLENLVQARTRLDQSGWPHELTQVAISHGEDLAGLTVLAPQRPVWVLQSRRPCV